MNYNIDVKSIIKEVKANKVTELGNIEELKKRIDTKLNIIETYNKYFILDIGFNMKKRAIVMTYDNEKERLEALEKYLDCVIKDYLDNGNIQQAVSE